MFDALDARFRLEYGVYMWTRGDAERGVSSGLATLLRRRQPKRDGSWARFGGFEGGGGVACMVLIVELCIWFDTRQRCYHTSDDGVLSLMWT